MRKDPGEDSYALTKWRLPRQRRRATRSRARPSSKPNAFRGLERKLLDHDDPQRRQLQGLAIARTDGSSAGDVDKFDAAITGSRGSSRDILALLVQRMSTWSMWTDGWRVAAAHRAAEPELRGTVSTFRECAIAASSVSADRCRRHMNSSADFWMVAASLTRSFRAWSIVNDVQGISISRVFIIAARSRRIYSSNGSYRSAARINSACDERLPEHDRRRGSSTPGAVSAKYSAKARLALSHGSRAVAAST